MRARVRGYGLCGNGRGLEFRSWGLSLPSAAAIHTNKFAHINTIRKLCIHKYATFCIIMILCTMYYAERGTQSEPMESNRQ